MRRIRQYGWAEIEQSRPIIPHHIISARDYRLLLAVVRAAEKAQNGLAVGSYLPAIWEALDRLNAKVKP